MLGALISFMCSGILRISKLTLGGRCRFLSEYSCINVSKKVFDTVAVITFCLLHTANMAPTRKVMVKSNATNTCS